MKLVYIHQYFKKPTDSGGIRSYEFARRLVSNGHEVHMVSSRKDPSGDKGWKTEDVDGITLHTCAVEYANEMPFSRRIRAFFEFAIRAARKSRSLNGDLLFATSTPLTVAVPGIYATLLRNTPFVLEVRDLWPDIPIALGALKRRSTKWAARLLEWVAYSRADAIVALSPDMKDGIVEKGIDPSKIVVIPNSSDLELFSHNEGDASRWRNKHPELGEEPFLLYAGTLGRVNNLLYLVDVAVELAQIPNSPKVVVIGSGAERDKVLAHAEKRGVLGSHFFLYRRIPKTEISAAYAASALTISTVLPLKELEANSANKFFDSLAAAKPILINHRGWMAELIDQEGIGCVVSPRDPSAAAREIMSLISDQTRLETMGLAARNLAETRFSRGALAAELNEVLVGVLRNSKTVPQ